MHKIYRRLTAAAAFLLLAGAAAAQDSDWYHQREERYRGEHWRGRLFAEVREDLDHVHTSVFAARDEYRMVRTKEELNELQDSLAAHRYDEAKLDNVIRAMQKVVADNRMRDRDRDMLNDDLQRMRDYRAHHERWLQEHEER